MVLSRRLRKKPVPLEEGPLYEYAVEALGRRMRTVADLKRLLRAKVEPGEPGESKIAAVVDRLKGHGYLDDAAFASTYARLRQENDSFGRGRVQRDLVRKGVSRDLIGPTLDRTYENVGEEELARRYLSRKRISRPQDEKHTARLIRRLAVAGFSFGTISAILKDWEIEIGEAELAVPDEE